MRKSVNRVSNSFPPLPFHVEKLLLWSNQIVVGSSPGSLKCMAASPDVLGTLQE